MRVRSPHAFFGGAAVIVASGCPGALLPFSVGRLVAQEAVVRVEENLRAEPNGAILGQVVPGTRVSVDAQEGGWTRATVQGFVFVPSLQVWTDGTFDLVVSAPDGENLRDEPSGRIAGRLGRGTLLDEVRRVPGWIEVSRSAWIWTASLTIEAAAETAAPAADAASAADAPPPSASTDVAEEFVRSRSADVPILAAQDGDTLAVVAPGADLRVLGREGNWTRIRLDGWVWTPGLDDGSAPGAGGGAAVLSGVSAEDFAADPEAFRGRLVELDLQFISLERAEQIRTDFYEGEPFLLTRSLGGGRTFVYVAIPPERLGDVEGISPLETVHVVGRLRSPSAALTGNPILDLVELRRGSG